MNNLLLDTLGTSDGMMLASSLNNFGLSSLEASRVSLGKPAVDGAGRAVTVVVRSRLPRQSWRRGVAVVPLWLLRMSWCVNCTITATATDGGLDSTWCCSKSDTVINPRNDTMGPVLA